MADYYLVTGIVVAIVALLSYGIPLFLAEYFPWRQIYRQKHGHPVHGHPVPTTKSYVGRTAVVTGANGAFGSRVAMIFGTRDIDTLVLVDLMDCSRVKADIEAEVKKLGKPVPNILVWQMDMMTLAGCKAFADQARQLEHIDHALMTAGILASKRKVSPDGWEASIQVNYLSSALNGLLLLPLLKASPGNPNPPVLSFVTSFGMYPSSFTMGAPAYGSYLKKMSSNKGGDYDQPHQYGRSKGLLLYFAKELAARVSAATGHPKVTINSADPGPAWTNLTNPNQGRLIPRLITNFGARDPQICATALANGVSAGPDSHGKILQDFDSVAYPPFILRRSGQAIQQRVWDETRAEFESKVPEVKAIYKSLGD